MSGAEELSGETFTDRCRRLLNEQPNQLKFTISRAGLETLVLDSERYGEQNKRAVAEHLAIKRYAESRRVKSLDDQMEELRSKYPESELSEVDEGRFRRLLTVPGVKLPKGWNSKQTTIYMYLPANYPNSQPHRFLTSADLTLESGGFPRNQLSPDAVRPDLIWWHWAIEKPIQRQTLLQYVRAMAARFELVE